MTHQRLAYMTFCVYIYIHIYMYIYYPCVIMLVQEPFVSRMFCTSHEGLVASTVSLEILDAASTGRGLVAVGCKNGTVQLFRAQVGGMR